MAEIAGLALGVVGVAGLYSVTVQVLEQIADAAAFSDDFRNQSTKFKTVKMSLQVWGADSGFAPDGTLLPDHNPIFDDAQLLYDVQSALVCIKDACEQLQTCLDRSSPPLSGQQQTSTGSASRVRVSTKIVSAGRRLRWVFKEKTKVEDLLNMIICLVGLLFKIARPKDATVVENAARLVQILNITQEQSLSLADALVKQAKELQRRKQEDIERWLDSPETQRFYHSALTRALPGTCQWIVEDCTLQRWIYSTNPETQDPIQHMWLYSRTPGAGKTTATSKLVQFLKEKRPEVVAYHFCTHETSSNHGYETILRSWILQLARYKGWASVEKAYDAFTEEDEPINLLSVLQSLLVNSPVYLIVDGVDEIGDLSGKYTANGVVGFLRSLLSALEQTSARLLIVSRFEPDIDRALTVDHVAGSRPTVTKSEIQLQQTMADIKLVAHHQVISRYTTWSPMDQDTAAEKLVERADGMFVLLHAILDQLGDGAMFFEAISTISQPLSGLSKTDMLQKAYQKQIERVLALPSAVRDLCLTVVLWVQHSAKPLRVGELLDILSVLYQKQPHSLDIPPIYSRKDLNSRLLRYCPSLLSAQYDTADFRQSTLHLAHYSVKEFLQSTGFIDESQFQHWRLFKGGPATQAYLAKACLYYLLQPKFSKYPAEPMAGNARAVYQYKEHFSKTLKDGNMFYDHASTFWSQYLDMSCGKPELVTFLHIQPRPKESASDLAAPNGSDMFKELKFMTEVLDSTEGTPRKFLPLDEELRSLSFQFLGLSSDENVCNYKLWRHYQLGLFTASGDDDYLSCAGDKLMHPARNRLVIKSWDYGPMYRVLDLCMAPRPLLDTYGPNPRWLRLQSRLLEMMCLQSMGLAALLVDQGADVNHTWPDNRTSFQLYSERTGGTKNIWVWYTFMTHFGASLEPNKPRHAVHVPIGTEVFRAGGGGWFTPRMLWGFLYGNVLQRKALSASTAGQDETYCYDMSDLDKIRIMINSHIEINNRSLLFPSVVHAAVMNKLLGKEAKLELLDILFRNGGDANVGAWLRPVGTFCGQNELDHPFRESVWEMILQLLPSGGVSHGRTFGSLLNFIEHSDYHFEWDREQIVGKVLSKRALENNSAGWLRHERLLLAVRRGDDEEVKNLLENGANVNKCGEWYGSSLYVASYVGNVAMVKLLLAHNADPNIAVKTKILRLELEKDFKWSTLWRSSFTRRDAAYTPLQAAAYKRHLDVTRLLIEHGANVNMNTDQTGTALYFSIRAASPKYMSTEWVEERRGGDTQYWQTLNNKDRVKSKAIIDLLLSSGAQVNLCGGRYWTPLQAACLIGEIHIVTTLLRHGADPNITGGEHGTALQALLSTFPDPNTDAINQGQVMQKDYWAIMPPSFFLYSLVLVRCAPLRDDGWSVHGMSTRRSPNDIALPITKLLLDHGADPTLLTKSSPWGTAIHTAAYHSSLPILELLLDPAYSDYTSRRTAANTRTHAMGLAINGPAVSARYDKIALLMTRAGAEFAWAPLLGLRLRRIGQVTLQRLELALIVVWHFKQVVIFVAAVGIMTAVATPVYLAWNELDRRSKEWDPRLGGLWMLVSVLASGWVVNLRDGWGQDTAW